MTILVVRLHGHGPHLCVWKLAPVWEPDDTVGPERGVERPVRVVSDHRRNHVGARLRLRNTDRDEPASAVNRDVDDARVRARERCRDHAVSPEALVCRTGAEKTRDGPDLRGVRTGVRDGPCHHDPGLAVDLLKSRAPASLERTQPDDSPCSVAEVRIQVARQARRVGKVRAERRHRIGQRAGVDLDEDREQLGALPGAAVGVRHDDVKVVWRGAGGDVNRGDQRRVAHELGRSNRYAGRVRRALQIEVRLGALLEALAPDRHVEPQRALVARVGVGGRSPGSAQRPPGRSRPTAGRAPAGRTPSR